MTNIETRQDMYEIIYAGLKELDEKCLIRVTGIIEGMIIKIESA